MKKKLWIAGIVFVVLAFAGVVFFRVRAQRAESGATNTQTATVERGSLASTLSSSGNTRSGQSATINWQTSGKVGEVTLKAGDVVKADQVLAGLDPNTLSSETIKAKQDLADSQQTLDELKNSKTTQAKAQQAVEDAQTSLNELKQTAASDAAAAQQTLATAQAALITAQKNRDKMNYPHSTDKLVIEQAQTKYLLAKQKYKDALQAYNLVDQKKLTDPERANALNNLVSAEADMKTKLATWNWYMLNYTPSDIAEADAALAVAKASVDKAQAEYDRLKNGASSAEIAMAEATLADAQRAWDEVKNGPSQTELEAAQAAVDAAQATLDNAQLLAPFAGTITKISVKTGDMVNSGDAAFRIDDLSSIYIDLQVSEVDLSNLKTGQPATIEFDAIADKTYKGEVTDIGMVGTVSQGVVNYPVTVRITDPDESIRTGMTATVNVTTDQVQDALLVPNKAIRTTGGQKTVTVLFEGQQISVPVTVGLTDGTRSQVIGDQLREGDTVVVTGSTSSNSSSSNSPNRQFRNNFEGPPGGFIAPGGP